jgi:hypothetical protein
MWSIYLQIIWLLYLFNAVTSIDVVGTKGCTASACVFANLWLRFGTGSQTSINAQGLFVQPFYFSQLTNTWYKLTYSNYPLDTAIGTGTTGPNWSGTTVVDLYSLTPSGSITDYSDFTVTSSDTTKSVGYGRIITNRTFTVNSQNIIMQNIFSLGYNDTFVKINNRIYNNAATTINNVYIWVGTRDDYVGNTDSNMKTRGNIVNGNFIPLTTVGQQSHAIMITNPTEGVLFYSETDGVNTVFDRCCAFANSYNLNPNTAPIATAAATDGSYAATLPLGNIPVGSSNAITWYYAAGTISSLSNVVQDVAVAQQAEASTTSTALPTSSETNSVSSTSSFSQTASETATVSASETKSQTETQTPSQTTSETSSQTNTQTKTQTSSKTATQTASQTETQTPSQTKTQTASQTKTQTPSQTASQTKTKTPSQTPSQTASQTSSQTKTQTASQTKTQTPSQTNTQTPSQTASQTKTPTQTKTQTPSQTETPTQTISQTANSTATSRYFITAWSSLSLTPNSTPTHTPTFMVTRYPSTQVTPTVTQTSLYMQIIYPSISSSPYPQPIVIEDKTNYSTQIILAGTAVGIAVVAGLGYALSNFIKSHNTDSNNAIHDDELKEKIKFILDRLQEDSKQNHCDTCRTYTHDTTEYVNELYELTKVHVSTVKRFPPQSV